VTNPSNYVWGPYGAAGNNGFTYGSGTGLNWSSFQTLTPEGVNNTPGTMFVPTLSLGSNAITLAPTMSIFDNSTQEFELDVYGLSGKASGSNHHALEYSSYFGAWTDILTSGDTDAYFWGVTTNAYDGALWGWTQGGTIYTNEAATLSGDGTILSQYTWSAGTGIAAGGPIGSAGSLWGHDFRTVLPVRQRVRALSTSCHREHFPAGPGINSRRAAQSRLLLILQAAGRTFLLKHLSWQRPYTRSVPMATFGS
jgi:hypothetical protein